MPYLLFLMIILLITIVIIVRTMRFAPEKIDITVKESEKISISRAVNNLAQAIKIKTISNTDYNETDWNKFKELIDFLKESYPKVFSKLQWELVNNYSILFRWKGREEELLPVLYTAHMDVVPVEKGTEGDWDFDAFSGMVKDDYLWGRGALDIKIQVIGILETVEQLLEEGYTPKRDIYIAFGHDEEVGGKQGATAIAALLKERGIKFEYVLDEGGCVTEGAMKGIEAPIAVIGIAEKGYANIKLTAASSGGHSSMPPKHTALGEIASAITKLEAHQLKTRIGSPIKEMLKFLGPHMSFGNRIIIANLWLFAPLFKKFFSSSLSGNALLRTTTAATMAEGSNAANILPQKASAVLNFRIAPWESSQELLDHIRKIVGPKISLEALRLEDPSNISPTNSYGFKLIASKIGRVFKGSIVCPYIVLAGTDARKYEELCNCIYRFSPYQIHNKDISSMHGTNEKISLENIERVLEFYREMMKEC